MRKIVCLLNFVFISLIMIVMLGACDTGKVPEHIHNYSEIYYNNTTSHWKECSCGEKNDKNNHIYGDWIIITEATETSVGSKKQVCNACDYENIVEIPKLEHIHNYGDIYYKDSTYHWKECFCGEKGNISEHGYGNWITITEATDTSVGLKKQICPTCSYENVVEIPKLEHVHKYSTEVINPTCESKGYTKYLCSCGDTYNDNEVAALGHTEVIDEAVTPTCTATGLTEGSHCSVCNETLIVQEEVAALGHTYENTLCKHCDRDEFGNLLGYEKNQDETYTISHVIELKTTSIELPSKYKGMLITSIGSSAFYDCSNLTSIEIPSSVTNIGYRAFYNCSSLTTITIPEGVTSIGSSAFRFCSSLTDMYYNGTIENWLNISFDLYDSNPMCHADNFYMKDENIEVEHNNLKYNLLTSIEIPSSVTSIGDYAFNKCSCITTLTFEKGSQLTSIGLSAFYGCSSLTSIEIPSGVTSIGDSAFKYCNNLTRIEIPKGVTSIEDYAFEYCSSLTTLTFEEGSQLTSIGSCAFYDCSSIINIEIPSSVTNIGYRAFYGCSSLTKIKIPFVGATLNGANDTHFGYIFGADEYRYNSKYVPSSLEEVIITGGSKIDSYAFYDCSDLTSIKIPSSVTSIEDYAFYNCISLPTIIIPTSVTCIGEGAFYDCFRLSKVYYEGTEGEYNAISVGSSNTQLNTARVYYYSDSEPQKKGNYWYYGENGNIKIWV